MWALQVAFISVNTHMLIQIAFLGKRLAAAKYWAHKWLLLSVRSEMIKKIVPFLKTSLTSLKLAKEDLCPSLTFRLKIFYVFKSSEIWYVQALLQGWQINIRPFFKYHFSIVGNSNSVHQRLLDVCGKVGVNAASRSLWTQGFLIVQNFGGM